MVEKTDVIIKDLGDGLVMRRSTVADAQRLGDFNAGIHGEDPFDAAAVAAWTRDLLLKEHPTFGKGDYTIVEDTATAEIISSMNTISQTWTYEGIPFKVGRPELVATDKRYRNRGLVREQFRVVHEWSCERGELVQVITGIPFYYRQYGYEMGLNLGGHRMGFEPNVPKLKEGEEEPYRFRPALEADIPWLLKMYRRDTGRSMIASVLDEAQMRHELLEKSKENVNRLELRVIETPEGQPVGYLAHPGFTWWGTVVCLMAVRYELDEGVSFLAVTPSVMRYLWKTGSEYAQERGKTVSGFGFSLGAEHPAYLAAGSRLPVERKPYAFYVRVPDLPAFLRQIAPALENRLKGSACEGHTSELKIGFYRDGLRMVFERGKLSCVERWKPGQDDSDASFPDLTFLQLVFGYRNLTEIRQAYADSSAKDEASLLLNTLFPKKNSNVFPVS